MGYQGYLLKIGTFDLTRYIEMGTYQVTPHQRTEIDAYRNGLNHLIREVAEHTTTKIEFRTALLSDSQMTEFLQALKKNYTIESERKVSATYFDVEDGDYKSGVFYIPDYTPSVLSWDGSFLTYDHMRLALIEY